MPYPPQNKLKLRMTVLFITIFKFDIYKLYCYSVMVSVCQHACALPLVDWLEINILINLKVFITEHADN